MKEMKELEDYLLDQISCCDYDCNYVCSELKKKTYQEILDKLREIERKS